MAIKEYSLLKIASILGVGPKLNNLFGFDLLVYDECIEFCMEECTLLNKIDENRRPTYSSSCERVFNHDTSKLPGTNYVRTGFKDFVEKLRHIPDIITVQLGWWSSYL